MANFQFTIRGYTFGAGCAVYNDAENPFTGWFSTAAKAQDSDLSFDHGAVGVADKWAVRVITHNLIISAGSSTSAMSSMASMVTAWAPSSVNIPLTGTFPSVGTLVAMGRPRQLSEDMTWLSRGVIRLQAVFVALDPTF